jgi:hypothetical protein
MTDIEFNPITFAFQVVKKAHPDLKFEFQFGYLDDESIDPKVYTGPWGQVDFETEVPTVLVDPRLPICAFAEILLHEIAHIVVGFEAEHSDAWEQEFDRLHSLYHEIFFELHADPNA